MGSHAFKYTMDPLPKYAAVTFMTSCDQRMYGLEQATKTSKGSQLISVVKRNSHQWGMAHLCRFEKLVSSGFFHRSRPTDVCSRVSSLFHIGA